MPKKSTVLENQLICGAAERGGKEMQSKEELERRICQSEPSMSREEYINQISGLIKKEEYEG